jgi:hypothetical protein
MLRYVVSYLTVTQQSVSFFVSFSAAEMLIESGMDLPAYKFVAAVANSLLADHIVFQSYVSTSSPGR